MKKSTLLSLATAGAIVATSAFTFAAWDVTQDSKTATLTFRKPVTITETVTTPAKAEYNLGAEVPAVEVPVSLEIANDDSKATSLSITPTIKDSKGNDITSKVSLAVKDSADATVTNNTVANPTTGTAAYKVVVTNNSATYDELNNAVVTVAAELS